MGLTVAPGSVTFAFVPWCAKLVIMTCMYVSLHTAIAHQNIHNGGIKLKINPGVGLSGKPIWKARVDKLFSCAEACVKKTRCKAITFNTETRLCQLHAELLADGNGQSGQTLVYSEFSWWPEQVDPACHSRPCGDYEVCVPTGQTADGYNVLCYPDARPVCPLPWKLNGSRHVGGVNVITCTEGYIGGGNATCQKNLTWTNAIKRCIRNRDCPLPAPLIWLPNINRFLCEGEFSVDEDSSNAGICAAVGNFTVSATRNLTVDSVITISCGDGYKGGGSATCLASNTIGYWSTTIQPCIKSEACQEGGNCYKKMTQRRNWDDSKTNCERTGGQLSSVETVEEHDFIAQNVLLANITLMTLAPRQFVWIGGTDREHESAFKWLNGTCVPSNRTWELYPYQPNNKDGNEDCMLYSIPSLTWYDGDCSLECPSLCEYKMG